MRTPLMPRRHAPAAQSGPAAPHPMDSMVDALRDRAAAVTDPRLKQVLLRAACVMVDRTLDAEET